MTDKEKMPKETTINVFEKGMPPTIVPDEYPVKNYNLKKIQEQTIFKEFEEMGYTIFYNGAYVVLVSDFKKINIFTVGNAYSYTCCSTTPPTRNEYLTMKEHQLLHRLFEIWGFFDEK